MNDREAAFRVLQRVETGGAFAAPLLESASDFTRHLALGVLRWRGRLDAHIETLSGRKITQIDLPALQLLRIGLYQLAFMNVPDHAAVAETMRIAAKTAPRAKPFVNAVLRRATKTPLPDDASLMSVRWSHPEWLVGKWSGFFGRARTEKILRANQELSYPDLLVRSREGMDILRAKGIAFTDSSIVPGAVRLRESTSRLAEEIRAGLFYPMDEGSLAVAALLPPDSGRLLDLTAAPGGKSIAAIDRGLSVVSNDLSPRRFAPLLRGIGRVVAGDATAPPFLPRSFDTILIDAPCSATGTIRKNPEIKWRLQRGDLAEFAALQRRILAAALELQPRKLLYATCSLEPEENDDVVDAVLSQQREYRRADLAALAPEPLRRWVDEGVFRITPEAETDGFTVTYIVR